MMSDKTPLLEDERSKEKWYMSRIEDLFDS